MVDNNEEFFDYAGYTEDRLNELTEDTYIYSGNSRWKYWSAESYGFGRGYRAYGFFPSFLPLHVWSTHGIWEGDFSEYDYNNDAPYMFVTSLEAKNEYEKKNAKPCFVVPAPLIAYRRYKRIKQIPNAKGTLIFPAHGCSNSKNLYSREELIEKIKAFPEKFKPVCVMLHMWDIRYGDHKIYMEHGIPVYTAGNNCDMRYGDRFFDVLKNFKYSMTNSQGSFMFYCIEMGIPCSMISEKGNELFLEDSEDRRKQKGEERYIRNALIDRANDLLRRADPEQISDEMKDFVYEYAGLKDGISRFKMTCLLYTAYVKDGDFLEDLKFFINNFFEIILPVQIMKQYIQWRYANNPYKLEKKLRRFR